jgi:hypothetical protein
MADSLARARRTASEGRLSSDRLGRNARGVPFGAAAADSELSMEAAALGDAAKADARLRRRPSGPDSRPAWRGDQRSG